MENVEFFPLPMYHLFTKCFNGCRRRLFTLFENCIRKEFVSFLLCVKFKILTLDEFFYVNKI